MNVVFNHIDNAVSYSKSGNLMAAHVSWKLAEAWMRQVEWRMREGA